MATEQGLAEMFEQARKLVSEADRRIAEEEERRLEKVRETKLMELSAQLEAGFDFTSKEKLELDQRLDVHNSRAAIEFVVRSVRAIFVLECAHEDSWALTVMEDGREPQKLGEFRGGSRNETGSRRLAAARVITAIGNWTENIPGAKRTPASSHQSRWQDQPQAVPAEKREPTYGTFGKFLGY